MRGQNFEKKLSNDNISKTEKRAKCQIFGNQNEQKNVNLVSIFQIKTVNINQGRERKCEMLRSSGRTQRSKRDRPEERVCSAEIWK